MPNYRKSKSSTVVGVRLDNDTYNVLKGVAALHAMSPAEYVKLVIIEHLKIT